MGDEQDRQAFESAARTLQADVTMAAAMATNDGIVRGRYQASIDAFVAEMRREARAGRITWAEAARRANETRNLTMEILRGRSSPIGRAIAERLKPEGRTLNELIARRTIQRFGPNAVFDALSAADRNLVLSDVVSGAARSNATVDSAVARASRAGRALLLLSVAISVYRVATSETPGRTAAREGAVLGGGILGGAAGGALAGLACGPGSPVCVTVGAFVGGAAVALGVELALPW